MEKTWDLYYPKYMIEDGCPHFSIGQSFEWPIAFYSEAPLTTAESRLKSAKLLRDFSTAAVIAEVVYISNTCSVIDFGLTAISVRSGLLPTACQVSDFVKGDINISLPLSHDVVPSDILARLKQTFKIISISADLTPYRQAGDRSWVRGGEVVYERVSSTKDRVAEAYVLHCEQMENNFTDTTL